jgi:hypothetical protein
MAVIAMFYGIIVKPYLNIGIFQELKNKSLFNSVKPFLGSVQWKNGQDFCPDTLYLESTPVQNLSTRISNEVEAVEEKIAL